MTMRHIVFDIGKVLIHYDPELPYRRIIPDAERRTWFLANVCTSDWNLEQDRGRPWDDAEAELIRAHWHEMVPHAYDGTVSILLGLIEEGRDITFLTNFAADTFVEAQELYPFLKAGRGVTVSGRVRVIKPDPAIYDLHTRTFDLDPEATLFIDDNADNVDAARAFGWNAVRFENAEALQADLQRFDLRLD